MTIAPLTRRLASTALLACGCLAPPAGALAADLHPAAPSIDVVHYAARIEPDLQARTVRGTVAIEFRGHADEALFDAGSLAVDAVEIHGRPAAYRRDGSTLRVALPRRRGDRAVLRIRFHGAPPYGMEFHPEHDELYTIFSTSQWLICVDSPAERATLDLSIVVPAGYTVAASGRAAGRRTLASGRIEHRWHLATPTPSFAYGFAVGRYTAAVDDTSRRNLRYLSTDRSADELRHVFRDTPDMIGLFESRAGLRLPDGYTQVLVADTAGQEAAGLALLSEAYAKSVLDDATAEGLIAHELAHQWWGISVTCKDWGQFWLNEGFATFMAAAYLQHRFGDDAYATQVGKWKARMDALKASGKDHPLVYGEWLRPTSDDRAVVYQKGAYFLHLLRQEMGETAFWAGMRRYTRAHAGGSVDTAAFEAAMSRAAGRDLSAFFAPWVAAQT